MIGRKQRPVVAGDRAMDKAGNLSSTQDVQSTGEGFQESFSFLHPTKLGRYIILRHLGNGGFGEVFLALNQA